MSSLASEVVTVTVGEGTDVKTFVLHEDILKQHSDFEDWQYINKDLPLLSVTVDDYEIFDIFANFAYTGELEAQTVQTASDPQRASREYCNRLLRCWDLGHTLLATHFQDAVMDELVQNSVKNGHLRAYSFADCADLYERFRGASLNSLQRLAVDIAVREWDAEDVKNLISPSLQFLRDVTIEFLRLHDKVKEAAVRGSGPAENYFEEVWMMHGCRYHEHGEEKPCYKTLG